MDSYKSITGTLYICKERGMFSRCYSERMFPGVQVFMIEWFNNMLFSIYYLLW